MTPKVIKYMIENKMCSTSDCHHITQIAHSLVPNKQATINDKINLLKIPAVLAKFEQDIINYLKNPPVEQIEKKLKEETLIIKKTKELFSTNESIQKSIELYDLIRVQEDILDEAIKSPFKFEKTKFFSGNYAEDIEQFDTLEEFIKEDPTNFETQLVSYIGNIIFRWKNNMGERHNDLIRTFRSDADLSNDDETRLEAHKMGRYSIEMIYDINDAEHLSLAYLLYRCQRVLKTNISIISVWLAYMTYRKQCSGVANNIEINYDKWYRQIVNFKYPIVLDNNGVISIMSDIYQVPDLNEILSKVYRAMRFTDESESNDRGLTGLTFVLWKLTKAYSEDSTIMNFVDRNIIALTRPILQKLSLEVRSACQYEYTLFLKQLSSTKPTVCNVVTMKILQGESFSKHLLEHSGNWIFNQLTFSKYFFDLMSIGFNIAEVLNQIPFPFPAYREIAKKYLQDKFGDISRPVIFKSETQREYIISNIGKEYNGFIRVMSPFLKVDEGSEFYNTQIQIVSKLISSSMNIYIKDSSKGDSKDMGNQFRKLLKELNLSEWEELGDFNSDNVLSVNDNICIIGKDKLLNHFKDKINHKTQSENKKAYTQYIQDPSNDICLIGLDGCMYLIPSSKSIGSKVMRLWVTTTGELVWEFVLYQYAM